MTNHTADTGRPRAHLEARRARIVDRVGRPIEPVGSGGVPLPRDRIDYLLREAEELYWNELAWEELTDEERVSGGHLTELVFPGFLAFVDGLLLDAVPARGYESSNPHPEVVEEILLFLAAQYASATGKLERGADSEKLVWARALTAHLIDLVMYRLYRLSPADREQLESRD